MHLFLFLWNLEHMIEIFIKICPYHRFSVEELKHGDLTCDVDLINCLRVWKVYTKVGCRKGKGISSNTKYSFSNTCNRCIRQYLTAIKSENGSKKVKNSVQWRSTSCMINDNDCKCVCDTLSVSLSCYYFSMFFFYQCM